MITSNPILKECCHGNIETDNSIVYWKFGNRIDFILYVYGAMDIWGGNVEQDRLREKIGVRIKSLKNEVLIDGITGRFTKVKRYSRMVALNGSIPSSDEFSTNFNMDRLKKLKGRKLSVTYLELTEEIGLIVC